MIDFDNGNTKKELIEFDFEFFLKQNISNNNYSQADIDSIYDAYVKICKDIDAKSNTTQAGLYAEGQVRKMFLGGLLTSLFGLNNNKGFLIMNFVATGENWAYFDVWKKYYKKKIWQEKIWDWITKIGSSMGIILTLVKIIELF